MTSQILDRSAFSLRQKFVDKWLAQKQTINRFIPSHREVGRETAFTWNPEWLKNGEKLHYRAMHGPEDNSGLKNVYRHLSLEPNDVKHGLLKVNRVPMRSFVGNYYAVLCHCMSVPASNVTDTGGTARSCAATGASATLYNAASGDSTFSHVVGSSSTAVSRTDNKLNTQISHGTTASTLQYGAQSVNDVVNPSGTITRIRSQRSFTGNPSSTANVQETGMYNKGWGSSSTWIFIMEHNLNNVGVVANGVVLTVTKDMETTT